MDPIEVVHRCCCCPGGWVQGSVSRALDVCGSVESDYTDLNRRTVRNVDGQLLEGVDYVVYDVASAASDRGRTAVRTGRDAVTGPPYTGTYVHD